MDRSLRRLNVERLSLVQVFWWDMAIGNAVEVPEVLKTCQQKGKIAHLGPTNRGADVMVPFLAAGYGIALAQVQYSLLDCRATRRFAQLGGRA